MPLLLLIDLLIESFEYTIKSIFCMAAKLGDLEIKMLWNRFN